jgi:hypothetical protein
MDLDHFLSWRTGTSSQYSTGESAHIKSSLGDCMFEIQNINEEENMLISGTREMSAVADSAEPKQ